MSVDDLEIVMCEGEVCEIRIYFDPAVPVEPGSWSQIKAKYQ